MKRKRPPSRLKRLPLIQNPPLAVDFVSFIGPSFLAFVATKTITRGVTTLVRKRYPGMPAYVVKHISVASAATAFAAAYYGAHRVQKLEAYHTPIVVGSAIALAQTVLQTYLPALRWLLIDATDQPALSGTPEPSLRARFTGPQESDAGAYAAGPYAPDAASAPTSSETADVDPTFGTFGDSSLWGESTSDDVLSQMGG